MNLREISASPAFFPRIRSTILRAFLGVILAYFKIAFDSISSTLYRCSLCRARMALERPRRREFTEFMPDHILRNIYGDEFFPVVDGERISDELRQDHGTP